MDLELKAGAEERRKNYKRLDFELATMYGSRITRWEYLRDSVNDKNVYVNLDTLEIIHAKTAICELCDRIWDQSDLHCKGCNAPRSANNQRWYRPLGFKDIRID